jgi:hypothetical protein
MICGIDAEQGVERVAHERQRLRRVDLLEARAFGEALVQRVRLGRGDAVRLTSMPVTCAPVRRAEEAGPPEPLATSSTRSPAERTSRDAQARYSSAVVQLVCPMSSP